MLKFGQEVDLEVLEKMSVNKTAEDLKEQLKKLEQKNTAELKAWQKVQFFSSALPRPAPPRRPPSIDLCQHALAAK